MKSLDMNNATQNIWHEINSWLRMLDYMQQEIIFMKNQLAEVVKTDITKEVLTGLEHYQNVFLTKDTVIAFFRKDIQQLKQQLNGISNNPVNTQTLRIDLRKMEHEFYSLKASYNDSIMQIY